MKHKTKETMWKQAIIAQQSLEQNQGFDFTEVAFIDFAISI